MTGTREELMSRIEELRKQVDDLKKYEQYRKMADETFAIKKSFVDAGFTEEQAMQILLVSIQTNGGKR